MQQEENSLQHYGVKGMRWGVRKRRNSPSSSSAPSAPKGPEEVTLRTTPKRIRTSGGKNHPATDAHVKTLVTKQVARASGVKSVSSEDLRAAIARMELENRFTKVRKEHDLAGQSSLEKMVASFVDSERKRIIKGDTPKSVDVLSTLFAPDGSANYAGKHVKKSGKN